MNIAIGTRLQDFRAAGSMGDVQDTLFVNCFWPKLDRPTRIFGAKASGIRVMGVPTPRNVWFPDDTVFEQYYPDALYPAEQAVIAAFPHRRIGKGSVTMAGMSTSEAMVWWEAYQAAVKSFPPTYTIFETLRNVNFLRHREERSRRTKVLPRDQVTENVDGTFTILKAGSTIEKIEYDEFVSLLTPEECRDLCDGKCDEATLRAERIDANQFHHCSEVHRAEDGTKTPVTLADWMAR